MGNGQEPRGRPSWWRLRLAGLSLFLRGDLARATQWLAGTKLKSPADWLTKSLGGVTSNAGVTVDFENALKLPSYLAPVMRMSQACASLPCQLIQKNNDGTRTPQDVPRSRLLARSGQANPDMSGTAYRQVSWFHLLTHGNWFSSKTVSNRGEVQELWPLDWQDVKEVSRGTDGELRYVYQDENGTKTDLRRSQVLHICGWSRNGLIGDDMVSSLQKPIGLGLAIYEQMEALFNEGGVPPGAISIEAPIRDPKAAKELENYFNATLKGARAKGRLGFLHNGAKYVPMGVSPKDLLLNEITLFVLREIARVYGIPSPIINDLAQTATFASTRELGRWFLIHCLRPWLRLVESGLDQFLLTQAERTKGWYWEHKLEEVLSADIQSRLEAYALGLSWGIYAIDEIREWENLDPVGGPAEDHYFPINYGKLGDSPNPNVKAPNTEAAAHALRGTWRGIQSAERRLRERLLKGVKKWAGEPTERGLADHLAEAIGGLGEYYESQVGWAVQCHSSILGRTPPNLPELIEDHIHETQRNLEQAIEAAPRERAVQVAEEFLGQKQLARVESISDAMLATPLGPPSEVSRNP